MFCFVDKSRYIRHCKSFNATRGDFCSKKLEVMETIALGYFMQKCIKCALFMGVLDFRMLSRYLEIFYGIQTNFHIESVNQQYLNKTAINIWCGN